MGIIRNSYLIVKNNTEYGVYLGLYVYSDWYVKDPKRYYIECTLSFIRNKKKFDMSGYAPNEIVELREETINPIDYIRNNISDYKEVTITRFVNEAIRQIGYETKDLKHIFRLNGHYSGVYLTNKEYSKFEKDTNSIKNLSKYFNYMGLINDWLNDCIDNERLYKQLLGLYDAKIIEKQEPHSRANLTVYSGKKELPLIFKKLDTDNIVLYRYWDEVIDTYLELDENGKEWVRKTVFQENNIDKSKLIQFIDGSNFFKAIINELNRRIFTTKRIKYVGGGCTYLFNLPNEIINKAVEEEDFISEELIQDIKKQYFKNKLMGLDYINTIVIKIDEKFNIEGIDLKCISEEKLESDYYCAGPKTLNKVFFKDITIYMNGEKLKLD